MKLERLFLTLVTGSLASFSAVAQHVHGVIELGLVVDGDAIAVSLKAPLSDVVGFEHDPENGDQEELLQQTASMLQDASTMFEFEESAKCEFSSVSVDGPDYLMQYIEEEGDAADHHDDDRHHKHDDHAEIIANYEWNCGDVSAFESLDLRFTQRFNNVDTIEIQILTSAGAQVRTLEGRVASISLSSR